MTDLKNIPTFVNMKNKLGNRLKIARIATGLSLEGLSKALGNSLSKQSLSMYEKGVMQPKEKNLLAIAAALGVPADYFTKTIDVIDVPMLRTSIGCSVTHEELEELETKVIYYAERYAMKILKTNFDSPDFINPLKEKIFSNKEDLSILADQLRCEWSCGDGVIPSILRLLERRGVWVFDAVLPENIIGLSTWIDKRQPVMVLDTRKEKTTVERLRFTAAHELAHLVLNLPEGINKEKICNQFASYFLLPQKTLINELGSKRESLYLDELIDLHDYYGVSIAAMVHEAYDFGIINKEHYDYWFDTIIKSNPKEEEWGEYLFPESLGKERRMDVIINNI